VLAAARGLKVSLIANPSLTGGDQMRVKTIALVAFMAATAGGAEVRAQGYAVRDLGTLGSTTLVNAINESGQATGSSLAAAGWRAYRYSGGTMRNLGTIGGPAGRTFGSGINASGQVVGGYDRGQGTTGAAFLHNGTALVDLGTLGGDFATADDINAAGVIAGYTSTGGGGFERAFLYSGGTKTDLGTLGGDFSIATAINDSGQVTGYSERPSNGWAHAFLYSGGTMRDLGSLGGDVSVGLDLSPSGQVVGWYDEWEFGQRAFLHDGVRMIALGTLGGRQSQALAINAWGDVVGNSDAADGSLHGFLYRDGAMVDLNNLVPAGVTVATANDINSAGQIVAEGTIAGLAGYRSMILTPNVPDRFAYAWADSPTAASYTPHPAYAYNSTGGAIHIDRQGVGLYNVSFQGLRGWGAGLSSAVAVTAYGSTTASCSSITYSSSPSSTVVLVGCFDAAGQRMADSRFTVMVVGNQSVPTPSAFVMSGGGAPVPPPNPAWSWTSGNHPITVTHQAGAGEYNVLLGTGNTPRSAKLVTATSGGGTRCNNATGISGGLRVRCYDWTGAATNQGFSVVQIAGGRPGKRAGFAVANLPTTASYTPAINSSFNSSGGAITATRSSVGRYAMNFAGLQKVGAATEHVQVAAISSPLATCNVVNWGNSIDGLFANVECRDGSGQFVDTRYDVLVIE
jgi:probable HAF family extracellular repeat protein